MILFPAIDLKDGNCVRLTRGDMNASTIYNDNPVAQAQIFEKAGFKYLHLVDLNGAIEGRSVNAAVVNDIIRQVSIPVQLGGGIRSIAAMDRWFAAGVSRIILGTIAVRDPNLVREACKKFPGRIVVGIDARGGKVAVSGWVEESELETGELASQFEDAGVAAIIFTDIDRDGTGQGPNIDATKALAQAVKIPIIGSGGVGSIDDIKAAKDAGLHGLIIGRALYDGSIDLNAAAKVR
jgi:phosphoribosylformimino-5-aminoimidazole carboxamide ribotide isomerase